MWLPSVVGRCPPSEQRAPIGSAAARSSKQRVPLCSALQLVHGNGLLRLVECLRLGYIKVCSPSEPFDEPLPVPSCEEKT